MEQEIETFNGKQSIGDFFKAILKRMGEEDTATAEMDMTVAGMVIGLEIKVTSITPVEASNG